MARIRSIKPEFFRHEGLQDLELANPGYYCMLVFAGLWAVSDRSGRFAWKPRTLKLDILPFLPFEMSETLGLLADAGFVVRYQVGREVYGMIPTWLKHQTGESLKNERERYPDPEDGFVLDPNPVPDESGTCPGTFPDKSGKHPGYVPDQSQIDPNLVPDESGTCPPRSLEHGKGKGMGTDVHPLPPAGSGGNSESGPDEPDSKPQRRASWTKGHPAEIIATTREICTLWPRPPEDLQPDGVTKVPGISAPEVAVRLQAILREGGEMHVCIAIARRAVQEYREGGKWIKAPQHFFGSSKEAPFRAHYQAYATNEALGKRKPKDPKEPDEPSEHQEAS